jgi:hypothetical protein
MQENKTLIKAQPKGIVMEVKKQTILSGLAEQEKEHGYFVLAIESFERGIKNFTVSLRSRKEHGYFVLAISL